MVRICRRTKKFELHSLLVAKKLYNVIQEVRKMKINTVDISEHKWPYHGWNNYDGTRFLY